MMVTIAKFWRTMPLPPSAQGRSYLLAREDTSKMEMHQVRYFLAVAQHLNFSRAAEECNVTQPSLSRAIQQLEGEFGGQLFHREHKFTHLTDLGHMVRPHLETIYNAAVK